MRSPVLSCFNQYLEFQGLNISVICLKRPGATEPRIHSLSMSKSPSLDNSQAYSRYAHDVSVHSQVWIRPAIVCIWLNFYVYCRVRRPRRTEPKILHTYRDVQEAVPYSPSCGVNSNPMITIPL